ncbi:hypothetical protein [Ferrimicrobium sp.]|uniref:hypothetical protein n=1 Tax=Ferrimicrobium sp. TaxID=2926050 RepID=UPI002605FBC7|nr:hypothetical protein [Ferrimicrobium sp.]
MRRSGTVLSLLGKGETLTVAKCCLVATTIYATMPLRVLCATHQADDTRCLLWRRSRLRRAWDHQLDRLLQTSDTPAPVIEVVFEQLATSPDPNSRLIPARNPNGPSRVLAQLANDWWWEVRAGVAANPSCPPQVQQTLVIDHNPWVRRALAENPQAEPGCVAALTTDVDFGVRDAAAEHPRCPADVQINLTTDDRWEIRRSIAKRQDAPLAALSLLAHDPESWVRFFVAANPNSPVHLRTQLQNDTDAKVRSMARHGGTATARIANSLAFGLNQGGSVAKTANDAHRP